MDKCPICAQRFSLSVLDNHIDICLSKPESKNSDKENNYQTNKNEINNEKNYSTTELENEIYRYRQSLQKIRDIVINGDQKYHKIAKFLYDKIEDDNRKFSKSFRKFRNKIENNQFELEKQKLENKNIEQILENNENNENLKNTEIFEIKESLKNNEKNDEIFEKHAKNNENFENNERKNEMKNESKKIRDLRIFKRPKETKKSQKSENIEKSPEEILLSKTNLFRSQPVLKRPFQTENIESLPNKLNKQFFNKNDQKIDQKIDLERKNDKFGENSIINNNLNEISSKNGQNFDKQKNEFEGKCVICKKILIKEMLFENPNCGESMCQYCIFKILSKNIDSKYYEKNPLLCLNENCSKTLPQWILNSLIPKDKVDDFFSQQFQYIAKQEKEIVSCPKCKYLFYPESGNLKDLEKTQTDEGKPISEAAKKHMVKNRFRCVECKSEFCRQCFSLPYHTGKTCEEFKDYKTSKKCVFCKEKIEEKFNSTTFDNCGSEECVSKAKFACDKINPCGHRCIGIKGHKKCLECLDKKCKAEGAPDKDDFCQICWVESFDSAACIKLSCNHIFHYHCIKQKIHKKWPGARITFGFLKCPLCKEIIKIDYPSELKQILQFEFEYYNLVLKLCLERIKLEGFENDPALLPGGNYYKKSSEFALRKFAFYVCFKCKLPYFGGMRNCEAVQEISEQYDKKSLVCGKCSAGKNAKKCLTHGTKFLTFKCKFCCSIANWFCWGKTHFCDKCHKKQANGIYLTKMKKSELPKCKGEQYCPLKIKHPPNGEEFSLGCVVCLKK